MGRHRRVPLKSGQIVIESRIGPGSDTPYHPRDVAHAVESRLGHNDKVCQSCSVKNPPEADNCRKCGRSNFRKVAGDYRGEGHSGANE